MPRGGAPEGQSPVFVPSETTLYLMVYAMHGRGDLFGNDADDFRPERWADLSPGWGFVPFGGGPRICIGRESILSSLSFKYLTPLETFALTEAMYTLIRILQSFSTVEAVDKNQSWRENLSVTLSTYSGCYSGCRTRLLRAT